MEKLEQIIINLSLEVLELKNELKASKESKDYWISQYVQESDKLKAITDVEVKEE